MKKRGFFTVCTENYHYLATALAKSVLQFSEYDMHVFCVNYFPSGEQKTEGVFFHNLSYELYDHEEAFQSSAHGNFYVNRKSTRSFQIMTRKYTASLAMLDLDYDECCFIDCDSLATPLVDEMFDYSDQITSHPLLSKGPHEYMMVLSNGEVERGDPFVGTWPMADNKKSLEWPLMNFLKMEPEERGAYLTANLFIFNRNCRKFLEVTEKFLDVLWRLVDVSWYAPFQDETVINVLLWKEKASYLPLSYINLTGFGTVQHFFETEVQNDQIFNLHGERFAFYKVPAEKRLIKIFHGEKRQEEIEKIMDYLSTNRKIFS